MSKSVLATARKSLHEAVARGRIRMPVTTRPSSNHPIKTEGLVCEELQFKSEDSPQGWVPLRIVQATPKPGHRRPVVVFLHATGQDLSSCNKDQESYAEAGYLTAAIDCRYHGARSSSPTQYSEALISAWRGTSQERPFLLDNVWDLTHLLDVITARDDVDVSRIGMTGISLGGMHTWLAAALDDRISVAAPMIGVQGFKWAIDNNLFQGRVDSIPALFAAAAADTKAPQVTAGLVQNVWDKLMPGLLTDYDSPMSLALIAPRPLLIANGELDPRCHVPGVEEALQGARQAYRAAGAEEKLEFWVDKGRGHEVSPTMKAKVRAWFDIYLGTKPLVESQQ